MRREAGLAAAAAVLKPIGNCVRLYGLAALALGLGLAGLCPPAAARSRVNRLLAELQRAQGPERVRLVKALGRAGSQEAAGPLLSLFDIRGASPRLSAAIVEALGRLKAREAVEPLAGAWDYLNTLRLQMEELPAHLQVLRGDILWALGEAGGDRAAKVLVDALEDHDPLVAEKAARGLGRLKDKRAVEALLGLLPRGGNLAQASYEALGEIGDKRAMGSLERELGNEDLMVQAQAAYALARIEGKQGGGARHLEKILVGEGLAPKAKILAAYYLAKLDLRSGLDHLAGVLKKGEPSLGLLAAEALGKSGNPKAVAPLAEASQSEGSSLRLMAAKSLGQLGGSKAIHALQRLKEDPNQAVKASVQAALEELGEAEEP